MIVTRWIPPSASKENYLIKKFYTLIIEGSDGGGNWGEWLRGVNRISHLIKEHNLQSIYFMLNTADIDISTEWVYRPKTFIPFWGVLAIKQHLNISINSFTGCLPQAMIDVKLKRHLILPVQIIIPSSNVQANPYWMMCLKALSALNEPRPTLEYCIGSVLKAAPDTASSNGYLCSIICEIW